jgi:predicted MFS family arabinose efflux permease
MPKLWLTPVSSSTVHSEKQIGFATLVVTVLAPFALGYFMSYLFRSVNAVVAPDLVTDIGLSASQLGLLTSAYLFAFALCQLPMGVMLDRFGPRRVQTVLLSCAAAGSALFAISDSAIVLTIARAMIGMGFAGGLMAGFKAVVLWVPEPRRALANASVMSFGALGLFVATVPTEFAVQAWGWRTLFGGLAVITMVVVAIIFFIVPERQSRSSAEPLGAQISAMLRLYRDPVFWRLAPFLATTAGTHIGIQTLWAGPWFRDVAGFGREAVAYHLGIVAVSFLAGILLSGVVADWFVRRGVGLLTVMTGILSLYLVAQAAIVFELTTLNVPMWIVFGMSGQVAVLAYPWMASYWGSALSGRANSAMNLIMFMTAFSAQYAIGAIIDLYPAGPDGGYDPRGYQTSFGILLGLQVLALGWYLLKVPKLPADKTSQSGS